MRVLVVVVGAACGAKPVPPHPRVELAAAGGGQLRLVEISEGHVRVVRTVATPGESIDALVWTADGPVMMLDIPSNLPTAPPDYIPQHQPTAHSYEVGRVAPAGYATLAKLGDIPWGAPPANADHDMQPEADLLVDPAGALWAERCEWSSDDGPHCSAKRYARLAPPPVTVVPHAPAAPAAPAPYSPPAPAEPRVEADGAFLACTDHGTRTSLPPEDDREAQKTLRGPVWLSADPPLFAATRVFEDGSESTIFYEGCKRAQNYDAFTTGPDGLVAIYGLRGVLILQDGRTIGTLEAAQHVVFGPRR